MTTKEYNDFLAESNHLVKNKKQNEEPFFYTNEDEKILDKVLNKAQKKRAKSAEVTEPQAA